MLKNTIPSSLQQQIITKLKTQNIFIAKSIDKIDDEFQYQDNSRISYRQQLKAMIKIYEMAQYRNQLDLVCKYAHQQQDEILIQYQTVRSMELNKSAKIIQCRILGLVSKHITLKQFVQIYEKYHTPCFTQKTDIIHKNKTLEYRKKWAQLKFGKMNSRKSSSQSFPQQIVIKPKPQPIKQKDSQRVQKRKLKLISGSEESSEEIMGKQLKRQNNRNRRKNENSNETKLFMKAKNFKSKNKKEVKNNSTDSDGLGSIIEADKYEQISNKKVITQRLQSQEMPLEKVEQEGKPNSRGCQGVLKKIIKMPINNQQLRSQSHTLSQKEEKQQERLLAELSLTHQSTSLLKANNSAEFKKPGNLEFENTKTTQPPNTVKQKKSKKNIPPPNNTTLDQFFKKK